MLLPDSGLGCLEVSSYQIFHKRRSIMSKLKWIRIWRSIMSKLKWIRIWLQLDFKLTSGGLINILKLSVKSPCLSPPILSFSANAESNEMLLNLTMKCCWNSAFNAQASRAIGRSGKRGWNSIYRQNWWKKPVWVPVILFRKISFPVMHLMPYYVKTGSSLPVITWLFTDNFIY